MVGEHRWHTPCPTRTARSGGTGVVSTAPSPSPGVSAPDPVPVAVPVADLAPQVELDCLSVAPDPDLFNGGCCARSLWSTLGRDHWVQALSSGPQVRE
jgi:hypothetical protein